MAINDISLTSGMRSNLTTLQSTAKLLDRTQNRLATGKKVNSAIDNPTSFFAAQSLNSRASIIDGLKDAMGQAIQTVQAADKGITAITSLIEQAKGVAQAAAAAPADLGGKTGTITLTGIAANDEIVIGGVTFTATDDASALDPAAGDFLASGNDAIDMMSLAEAINKYDWTSEAETFKATITNGALSISKTDNTPGQVGEVLDVAATDFINTGVVGGGTAEMEVVDSTSGDLASLQIQFNSILDQIDFLAEDSGYKGKNLLTGNEGTGLLTVKFEGTHSLDVVGFNAKSGKEGGDVGLRVESAKWTDDPDPDAIADAISASLTQLDNALSTLRQNAAAFSANLSIITTRQDFSTNMVTTLTDGADKLTLADTNEEGANMLMLQTRQSLGTTALSLSAQAAQSVLRLFG